MFRVLGLDLSMSTPGFAVVEFTNGKPVLVHKSHVKTNAKNTHGQRLVQTADYLRNLIDVYGPFNAVAREKGFSAHANTTQVLFKVVGVSDLELAREGYTRVADIAPTSVKKAVTGNGKASKDEVADALEQYVGKHLYGTSDESDAVAVALAYGIQNKLMEAL